MNISKTELQDKGICSCYCAIREWFGRVSVIHPDSAKLFFFDITNFIFIILNLTYVPIETVINTPFIDIYGPKWYVYLIFLHNSFIKNTFLTLQLI